MTIFIFALKRSFRNPLNIAFMCLPPLLVIFLLSNDTWYILPTGFQLYGVFLLFIASRLAGILLEDRATGILKRIGAAPVTHFQYLWQNLLAFALLLVTQCAVVVAGGWLYGHELVRPGLLLAVYVLFAVTAISMSLAWFSFFRMKETASSVFFGIIMIGSMAGGLFWPVEIMPAVMQRLAMLLPMYWLAEAMSATVHGTRTIDFAVPSVILVLFTFVFLIVGSKRQLS